MDDQPDDQELLDAIQTSDPNALLVLYRRYSGRVYSLSYRILNDRMAAEEVLQDVFLRLWQVSQRYKAEKGLLLSWLLTVTRNISLDRLRKESRRADNFVSLSMGEDFCDRLPSADPTESGIDPELVRFALDSLPDDQRAALELSYFEGLTHVELASRLGEPLGTIKGRLRLGVKKLRNILVSSRKSV